MFTHALGLWLRDNVNLVGGEALWFCEYHRGQWNIPFMSSGSKDTACIPTHRIKEIHKRADITQPLIFQDLAELLQKTNQLSVINGMASLSEARQLPRPYHSIGNSLLPATSLKQKAFI